MTVRIARIAHFNLFVAGVVFLIALTACAALAVGPRQRTTRSNSSPQPTAQQSPQSATSASFDIDRRPVRAINMFNGNLADPNGKQAKWASDDATAIRWLRSTLDRNVAKGYTRFVFILPAGVDRSIDPATGRKVPMAASQWEPLPPSRKSSLKAFLAEWLPRHPAVTIGYYAGFDLDPDPSDINYAGHTVPDFNKESDRLAMQRLVTPWIDQIGVKEIWWDTASKSNRRDQAVLFSHWLAQRGVKAGGEAMPRVWPNYNGTLDTKYLNAMPWMALINYYHQYDPKNRWTAGPRTTEAFVGLRGGEKNTSDLDLLGFFRRGFIPWVYAYSLEDRVIKLWRQANGAGLQFPHTQTTPGSELGTSQSKNKTRSRTRHHQ